MSHSTVLVITKSKEDLEAALAPFDENREVEAHFVALEDPTDPDEAWKPLTSFRKYCNENHNIPLDAPLEQLVGYVQGWESYPGLMQDGKLGYMSTYNPQSRWDWYSIGGRWSGSLMSTDPDRHLEPQRPWPGEAPQVYEATECDQSRKRYIDWDAMGARKVEHAKHDYAEAEAKIAEKSNFPITMIYGFDPREITLDEYVKQQVATPFSTFAVLTLDGKWYERGKMGWFGAVLDESEPEEWAVTFKRLLDEVDGDHWLTVVDVHI